MEKNGSTHIFKPSKLYRVEYSFAIFPKASEKHKRCDSPFGFACVKTFIPLSVGGEIINILKLLIFES